VKKKDLIAALRDVGYPGSRTARAEISPEMILEILQDIVHSGDPNLMEAFPAVLAYCGRKGFRLDFSGWLGGMETKSKWRPVVEQLLLLSYGLLKEENVKIPAGLGRLAQSLKEKHVQDLSKDSMGPVGEIPLTRKGFSREIQGLEKNGPRPPSLRKNPSEYRTVRFHLHLNTLFSPRQLELVFKRLRGESFTKTEREYYSRVVKKKLEAIASAEVIQLAETLVNKGRKS